MVTNSTQSENKRRPLNILYIEDDAAIGLLMKTVVELHGDRVDVVSTGKEGLKLFETGQFDIVVIDYQLPDMTGIEIGRNILMESRDVPLIMVTGRGNERLASEALNLGFTEYLVKDDSDVFLELVPSVIEHCWKRKIEKNQFRETRDLLTEVSDRFESLIQLSPDGLMVISEEKVVYANPAMDYVFGDVRSANLFGKKIQDLAPPDTAATISECLDQTVSQKLAKKTIQINVSGLNGSMRSLDISAGYCEFSGVPAVQMVVHDVTESKVIEEELRVAKVTADGANRAKSDFLSSMSHELRTPLNAVLGFSQLLLLDQKDPISETHRSNVALIMRSGEHLLTLIDDLLDFSTIEAGRLTVSLEPHDLEPLINDAVGMIEFQAIGRGISIQTTNPPAHEGSPLALIDPNRFRQVMVNLISNAVKYNKDNGTIFISVAFHTPKSIRVSVRDTGMGIPGDLETDLFEPFERLNAEKKAIQGTGIGLPITKRLIELMGGRIGFESVLNIGSTFWVDVSVAEDPIA